MHIDSWRHRAETLADKALRAGAFGDHARAEALRAQARGMLAAGQIAIEDEMLRLRRADMEIGEAETESRADMATRWAERAMGAAA